MAFNARFNVAFDTVYLAYSPLQQAEIEPEAVEEAFYSDGETVPEGEWTAFVSPFDVSTNAGIGLLLHLEDGTYLEYLAHLPRLPEVEGVVYIPFADQQVAMRIEHLADGTLVYSYSTDRLLTWIESAVITPASPVSEVGVVLRYDSPGSPATGHIAEARLVTGIWQNIVEEVFIGEPGPAGDPKGADDVATVTSTAEPLVHVIVGAQFGDLEFDVGKSVRWITWYCDNVFILDINLGTQRYWIVNWAETFPDSKHAVTGINYFNNPAEFRAEQWRRYKMAFGEPHDDDWILWIDGHEGFSVDNRSLPDDYDFAPFKSFLWREIQRAQDLGESSAVLPLYVFLRSDNVTNVTYTRLIDNLDPDNTVPPVVQALAVPYYEPYQGMRRLWNAGALKDPSFDWTRIDRPEAPSPDAKAQIISYGYAHWNLQDIEPPQTVVPPLTAENDDGWRMRKLLSKVRPIPGLPVGDTWISPSDDPLGLPGPWAPADINNPDPIDPATGEPLAPPVPPDPSLEGIVTPLYDCVVRLNMRDGVWYEAGASGNIPLKWDEASQTWTTDYDPAEWADHGVKSYDPTAVPDPVP